MLGFVCQMGLEQDSGLNLRVRVKIPILILYDAFKNLVENVYLSLESHLIIVIENIFLNP